MRPSLLATLKFAIASTAACATLVGSSLVGGVPESGEWGAAWAQDGLAPADDDAPSDPLAVPSVDALEAPPEVRLAELTRELYSAIVDWNALGERTCDQMWRPVRSFLDANEAEVESVASALADRAETMSEEEKVALGEFFGRELDADPVVAEGQAILYPCLRSGDVQGKGRPLDKEMRRFFRLQRPLIDAVVGNVD